MDSDGGVWDGPQVNATPMWHQTLKMTTMVNLQREKALSTGKVRADRETLKGARVRLGLDQAKLAQAAGLTRKTVSNFETSKTEPHESTRAAVQQALELRGIVFTNGDKPGFFFDKDKIVIPT